MEFIENKNYKHAVVFDINDTLITKVRSNDQRAKTYKHRVKSFAVNPKPHLAALKQHLEERKFYSVAWSSMKARNLVGYIKLLETYGITFDLVLSESECSSSMTGSEKYSVKKKDLRVVAAKTGLMVEHVILVDNDKKKRVGDQNFYLISDETDGLLGAIGCLEEFVSK